VIADDAGGHSPSWRHQRVGGSVDSSVLLLNALLGLGTVLAPVFGRPGG
jgi:hypothetical protein